MTSEVRDRLKALERENRELRQANEIRVRGAGSAESFRLFCPGGARPPVQAMIAFIDEHRAVHGSSRSAAFCRSPPRRITPTPPGAPIRVSCLHGPSP